jgi:DNA relaxase NicK
MCNTGVPFVEAGLDYLRGSFPAENFPAIKVLVEQVTRSRFLDDEYSGGRFYRRVYKNSVGAYLKTHPTWKGTTKCCVEIPGSVLSTIEPVDQLFLMKELFNNGFNCTRLDIFLDDYTKEITPELVKEAVDLGNQTGFFQNPYTEWYSSGCVGEEQSKTYYIGRRGDNGSGKVIRCYNKYLESKGEIDANRIEAEFSEHYSKNAFAKLIDFPVSSWPEVILALMTGAVDFIDRSSSEVVADCVRLDWWSAIVDDVGRIRVSKPRKKKTIKKAIDWVERQVLPTLAMVIGYHFESTQMDVQELFWEMFLRGEKRMTEVHHSILNQSLLC